MILEQLTRVVFDEGSHLYILDGSALLPGVTEIMKKHGLSAQYGDVSEAVLAHAAELGTQAHKAIEDYCNGVSVPETPLIKSFRKLGLNIVHTELLVSDCRTVASSIDLLQEKEDGVFDIIDMKRTSTVHKDALAWQLGIYKYLFLMMYPEAKVDKCYCLPIKKGNKDDILADTCKALVEITPVSAEEVEKLLSCEEMGLDYMASAMPDAGDLIPADQALILSEALATLPAKKAELERLEAVADAIKSELLAKMVEKGVSEVSIAHGNIKVKESYTRTSIDSKALKKDHPDIFERYAKATIIAPSLTIKLN